MSTKLRFLAPILFLAILGGCTQPGASTDTSTSTTTTKTTTKAGDIKIGYIVKQPEERWFQIETMFEVMPGTGVSWLPNSAATLSVRLSALPLRLNLGSKRAENTNCPGASVVADALVDGAEQLPAASHAATA